VIDGKGQTRPAGMIEFPPSAEYRKAFYSVTRTIITKETDDFVFLQPVIKARVKFRNWTKSGILRSPVFVDFVFDQEAKS